MTNVKDRPRTEDQPATALFGVGHRLPLPNGYWLQKDDENKWQIGGPFGGTADVFLALNVSGNVPVGPGGSLDEEIKEFAEGLMKGAA